jgi:hypothetical protein
MKLPELNKDFEDYTYGLLERYPDRRLTWQAVQPAGNPERESRWLRTSPGTPTKDVKDYTNLVKRLRSHNVTVNRLKLFDPEAT